MRIDINLASQPYEDARQFWMRWGTAVGALGILTLILLALDITGWNNARKDRLSMSQTRTLIADRDRVRADAERVLNLPENRTTRDESQFLNQLIERKAFSWTRVLENLEKVMPPRVHVVSISPQLNEDNELALKMTVAGESRDRAIELARRMEESHRFAQTQIVREATAAQSQNGDTELCELVAIYIPEAPPDLTAAPAPAPAAATNGKPAGEAKPKSLAAKGGKQ
jgi:type IV pilus assembly protein PilN